MACFLKNSQASGIFNLGTGVAQPFNDVANAVIKNFKSGSIEYISFPEHLKGHYQCFTQANIDKLRGVGCNHVFKDVEDGVTAYMKWLNKKHI